MKKLLVLALVLLSACTADTLEFDRKVRRDRQRDAQECRTKGGLLVHHEDDGDSGRRSSSCFAIDSIIPMTGAREAPNFNGGR